VNILYKISKITHSTRQFTQKMPKKHLILAYFM